MLAALGVAVISCTVSCTLTQDDYRPTLTESGTAQPEPEPVDDSAAPAPEPEVSEGCSVSLECPDGFECAGDVCVPSGCNPAEDVSACVVDVCEGDECLPATCRDGEQGDGETGLDCGGPCLPCASDAGCSDDAECAPGACVEGRCAEPSCQDGLTNQDETGADCGGTTCARCGVGVGCAADSDCGDGLFCPSMTSSCSPVSCQDGVQNGGERGMDCGGGSCPGCEVGAPCETPNDCASSSCVEGNCAAPSCADGVRNGGESDVDCGGDCDACGTGLACNAAADCTSSVCEDDDCDPGAATCCQAPACNDGVRNGNETAVDCGVAPCGRCDEGAPCTQGNQCDSNVCAGGACAELCDDGVRDGNESAADCGGTEVGCPRCDDGDVCASDADCASGECDAGVCVSCSDGSENGDEEGVDCGSSEPGCPACPRCSVENSTDLGGVGNVSNITGDACARITAFPGYAPTLFDTFEGGTYPVPFSYRQECTGVGGTGTFDTEYDRVVFAGLGTGCAVIIDLAGPSAPLQVRWY